MLKKIFLGSAQFGLDYGLTNKSGKVKISELKRILDLAKELGIYGIDTSPNYGNAEEVLGKLDIENFKVSTKIPSIRLSHDLSIKDQIRHYINKSLRHLRKDCIDVCLLHDENNIYEDFSEEIIEEIEVQKRIGKIKDFGISAYSFQRLEESGLLDNCDVVQGPYNIADKSFDKYAEKFKKKSTKFHARSIFLQGLLLQDYINIPKYFSRWKDSFLEIEKLKKIHNCTSADICIQAIKKNEFIDSVVIGIENEQQLRDIFDSFKRDMQSLNINFNHIRELQDPRLWKI